MKKLLLILTLITVVSGFVPATSTAQMICTDPNLISFSFDQDEIIADTTAAPYSQTTVYVYLLNPEDSCVGAFELGIVLPENLLILAINYPFEVINVGSNTNLIVGFANNLPVVDNRVLLCSIVLLNTDPYGSPQQIFLTPASPASIPGHMAFLGCDENIIPCDPISLGYDLPVAQINGIEPLDYCNSHVIDGLSVSIACQGDSDNLAGTSSMATDDFDEVWDLEDTDPNPVVFFSHPEWNVPGVTNFKQDVQSLFNPDTQAKTWNFTVNATVPEGQSVPYTVPLDFEPSFADDPEVLMTLVDGTNGVTTILESPYQYEYSIVENESRNFSLVIGDDSVPPPELDLTVNIDVTAGGMSDLGNLAATAVAATDGFDLGLDMPEPGPPPANYLTASFFHYGWPFGPRFQQDVYGVFDPLLENRSWLLRVETDLVGPVTMDFSPNFDETSNFSLFLVDDQSSEIIDLYQNPSFSFDNQSASVRDFHLVIGNLTPPDLTPSSRFLNNGWSLLGLPLVPPPGQETLDEVILTDNQETSYLFSYQTDSGYLPENPSNPAVQGRGYWLTTNNDFTWNMDGDRDLEPISLPLSPGWNLVGYPLWFSGSVNFIQVQHGGQTLTWTQAVEADLVLGSLLGFDSYSNEYFTTETLQTWHGYWMAALVPDVTLVFDWEYFIQVPGGATQPEHLDYPPEESWTTELSATASGQDLTHHVLFGVRPEATSGFDNQLDVPLAPSSPGGTGHLGLLRPQWDLPCGNTMFQDFVSPDDEPLAWDAEIVQEPGKVVTLQWDRRNWPQDLDLQLYLPNQNRVVVRSMRTANSVRLSAPDGHLLVRIRTPQMSGLQDVPGAFNGLAVHPNPFNPQTTIAFDLPRPGQAEVCIYTVRGEMIASLKADGTAAGHHELIWLGRDRAGREVPSGSYFARLRLDGQPLGPVAKMSLVR